METSMPLKRVTPVGMALLNDDDAQQIRWTRAAGRVSHHDWSGDA